MKKQRIYSAIRRNRQFIPLLVLIAYGIDTALKALQGRVSMGGITYYFSLNQEHYLGYAAIAINLLTYFRFRQYYKYTLTFTIAIGLLGLIAFSALQMKWSIGVINGLQIGLQVSAFLAGLTAYVINFRSVNERLVYYLGRKKTLKEKVQSREVISAERIQKFKQRYYNYSEEKLQEILTTNRYLPEAMEAARQITNERQHESN